MFEGARTRIAAFTGSTAGETIFTRNATEAINLVAWSWGRGNVGEGDVIAVTQMEHHSNIVPWQMLAQERGATLAYVAVGDDGLLDLDSLDEVLARGPKLLAVAHVSNVLSTVNPIAEIARRAHAAGAVVMVDGAQAVPHLPVDVARARRRLLRLDRAQGLRPDRHRRPARPPRAARGDAAVARRRAHDQARRRPGVHLRRAARSLRGRDLRRRRGDRPRRRRRLPVGDRDGRGARARARDRRLRARAPARGGRADAVRARRSRVSAAASSRSTSTACTRTTSRRSSAARASASAPATTARSR